MTSCLQPNATKSDNQYRAHKFGMNNLSIISLSHPYFMVSLDIEMLWGFVHTHEYRLIKLLTKAGGNEIRKCVEFLLEQFEKYQISVTWAFVGHLFLDHCEKEDGIPHKDMIRPSKDWYSIDPCTDIKTNPLFYGRDIVESVLGSDLDHEIGYHSFSHVIFSKCERDVAEAEIKKGIEVAKDFGIEFVSFVFPDNQIGHLDLLYSNGFRIFRGIRPRKYCYYQNDLKNSLCNTQQSGSTPIKSFFL